MAIVTHFLCSMFSNFSKNIFDQFGTTIFPFPVFWPNFYCKERNALITTNPLDNTITHNKLKLLNQKTFYSKQKF